MAPPIEFSIGARPSSVNTLLLAPAPSGFRLSGAPRLRLGIEPLLGTGEARGGREVLEYSTGDRKELSVPCLRNFAYFDYRGTFPPTIYSAVREPYHYVAEVSRTESDGHERSLDELLRAARILISNHLGPSAAEELTGRAPTEITQEDFDRMRTRPVRGSVMPGGVYRVRDC